jgi:hypothetical protein
MQPIRPRVQPAVWCLRARCGILSRMTNKTSTLLLAVLVLLLSSTALLKSATPPRGSGPEYSGDQMKFPENYREWIYLTTGFDMSYNKAAMQMDHHMFDNVFVNPEAYKGFVETGTWPDKTMLVLEGRKAEGKGSINQKGNFQTTDIMGREVHVKDESRFPGKWAFFTFDDSKLGKMVPTNMECYSCHSQHAAVDTTFVQFYPTLLPIAKSKGTLSASYQKEVATADQK